MISGSEAGLPSCVLLVGLEHVLCFFECFADTFGEAAGGGLIEPAGGGVIAEG